jgi:hypothetical protein
MVNVLCVLIVSYFVYKIMTAGSVDKKGLAAAMEKSLLSLIKETKDDLNKYEATRNGDNINEQEQIAFQEFKKSLENKEQVVKNKFIEFGKDM